jgi:hypothetical protein
MDIFNALNTNCFIFRTISEHLDYKNRQLLLYRAESLFVRRPVKKKQHKYTVWAEVEFLNVKPCSR